MAGKGRGGGNSAPKSPISDRKNNKSSKKRPKVFDSVKRRLVTKDV